MRQYTHFEAHLSKTALRVASTFLILIFQIFLLIASHPTNAADLKVGVKVYNEACVECHSLKEGKNKKGPSIYGIIGRKAATAADYDYSEAMKNSNLVWTEQKLDEYLASPGKLVPGGKMKFEGLSDSEKRSGIIQYLKFVSE